jgi:hypothetical protein
VFMMNNEINIEMGIKRELKEYRKRNKYDEPFEVTFYWFDSLCSECYNLMNRSNAPVEMFDYGEPIYCEKCKEYQFPIVVLKVNFKCNSAEEDKGKYIDEGWKIIAIDGVGITSAKEIENGE